MADINQAIVCEMLRTLQAKGVELSKINLQKTAYFLKSWGVSLGLRFRPYTYGPYSTDLVKCLSELEFWDCLKLKGSTYEIIDLPNDELDSKETDCIHQCIDVIFDKVIMSRAPSFQDMEVLGTALYCRNALIAAGEAVTPEAVVNQFKAWKGQSYAEEIILEAHNKLENALMQ